MHHTMRLFALALVFAATSLGWLVLAAVTSTRASEQESSLYGRVGELWGTPHHQQAPALTVRWMEVERRTQVVTAPNGKESTREELVPVERSAAVSPGSTSINVDMREDIRRKGLMWFPLYDLDFEGRWTYVHEGDNTGTLDVAWRFPDPGGFYDGFRLAVDGVDQTDSVTGQVAMKSVAIAPGQTVTIEVAYTTRGTAEWSYQPTEGVGEIEAFALTMNTDFRDIDYPQGALSPTTRVETDAGWTLTWDFDRLVSGNGMGMVVPCPIQPGELASRLALSAPISLLLFMVWIHVLGLLKNIDVHPINHAFLAAAFFSFHMLFGYTADHLTTEAAFALSSVVSVALVVTYLVRVVSPRFAVVEAGGAQLVYLVGFAGAHFLDGMTGLTLTVIGVATLFALMQLTAHIRWTELFASDAAPTPHSLPPANPASTA
jgi:hypothetical protein